MIRSMKLFWRRVRGREPVLGTTEEDTSARILNNLKARRDSGKILSRASEQYLTKHTQGEE